jgi:hypothetical protein
LRLSVKGLVEALIGPMETIRKGVPSSVLLLLVLEIALRVL